MDAQKAKAKAKTNGHSISGLIGIQPVVDFLSTVLWTARVNGERPVSAILVAPPGHGKTSLLMAVQSKWSHYTDDLTSRELSHILSEYPDISHILLADMTSIFNRKNSTAELTCNILRRAIEEGLEVDSFSGSHMDRRRVGLITAIPPDDLESRKINKQLMEGGFASRFIIVKYGYSQATKRKIHEWIKSDAYTKEITRTIQVEDRRAEVKIPPRYSDKLNLLAMDIKRDPLGARAHHHLRALAKAHALEHRRFEVTETDFRAVEIYSEFFTKKGRTL